MFRFATLKMYITYAHVAAVTLFPWILTGSD